jgi:hypothetical protein
LTAAADYFSSGVLSPEYLRLQKIGTKLKEVGNGTRHDPGRHRRQIADYLEKLFEAAGSRGGFMLGRSSMRTARPDAEHRRP